MKFVSGISRHDPDNGTLGDCFRACIASLLDLEAAEVPHTDAEITFGEWDTMYRDFLHDRGYRKIALPLVASSLEEALSITAGWADGLPYIFSGACRRGIAHAVIAQHGKIIHDPAGSAEPYIFGPFTGDGRYGCEFIVPFQQGGAQ